MVKSHYGQKVRKQNGQEKNAGDGEKRMRLRRRKKPPAFGAVPVQADQMSFFNRPKCGPTHFVSKLLFNFKNIAQNFCATHFCTYFSYM
jgi:hypothetical protein